MSAGTLGTEDTGSVAEDTGTEVTGSVAAGTQGAAPGELRPLRADAERNRRLILAAAAQLFAQRGLDVGLDEIAREAGVGTGTVYRRFPDKAKLVEALFQDRIHAMVQRAREAGAHQDPWTGLVSFMEGMAQQQLADRGLKEVLFGDNCPGHSVPGQRADLVLVVDSLVRRAQASGQLRSDVTGSDLVMIQVMLHAAGAFSADADADAWRRQLALILDGLRVARAAPSPLPVPPMPAAEIERLCRVSPTGPGSRTTSARSLAPRSAPPR